MTEPWTITFDPEPPSQGGQLTIGGKPGEVVDLDWSPSGAPDSVTIGQDGTVTITVPANATSLIASDRNGVADDKTTPILPD